MENILNNFNKNNCCGCLCCVDVCPTGALSKGKDAYGFSIPVIDESKCIKCGKCTKVCPYKSINNSNKSFLAYAAINKNKKEEIKSSSGGLFPIFAREIIEHGGVVYGATMDDNFEVRHLRIDNYDEIENLQKSKYVQSNTLNIFSKVKQDLKDNYVVLFSGTPCQISALKSFLKEKYYSNLYCIDIVCHGVPNQDLFDDYINNLSSIKGKICKYQFRAKSNNSVGITWMFSYTLKKNMKTYIKNWPEDSFNYFYMKKLIYRDSCYNCKFASSKRASDITLCDFWGWNNYHKDFFDSISSVSGCIINTQKGLELFDLVKKDMIFCKSRYDWILNNNSCLNGTDSMPNERDVVLNEWRDKGYQYIDNKFRKKHMKQILKYRFLRLLPISIRQFGLKIRRGD